MMPRMTDHRPWFASYPSDVRLSLEPYPHESLFAILDAAAGRYPNKPALAWFGKHMTYAQLLGEVERCSAMLTALGVTKGDRVALIVPNSRETCSLVRMPIQTGACAKPLDSNHIAAFRLRWERWDSRTLSCSNPNLCASNSRRQQRRSWCSCTP
jgi:acyl-coenzyme A synthetase/AMP-(fatty) acid ligase